MAADAFAAVPARGAGTPTSFAAQWLGLERVQVIEGQVTKIGVGELTGSQLTPELLQRYQYRLAELTRIGRWPGHSLYIQGDD